MAVPLAQFGRTAVVRLVMPAVIGAFTGACVAVAGALVEGEALGWVAAQPGLIPVALVSLALLVTLAVSLGITRVAHPSTAELYIETYHDPAARIPIGQLPGRVLAAAATVGLGGAQGLESPSTLIGAGAGDVLGARALVAARSRRCTRADGGGSECRHRGRLLLARAGHVLRHGGSVPP